MRYSLFPATFNNALNLTQLGEASGSFGNEVDDIIPGGAVDRAAAIVRQAAPSFRLRTPDLSTAFGGISLTAGLSCSAVSTFRFQKRASGGVFQGSTSNLTVTCNNGFLFPTRVGASGNGPQMAILDLSFLPLF